MNEEQKTGTKRVSMCISVRGALGELQRSRKKGSYWTDDNGKPLTRLEAIDALCDDLAAGRETLPLGKDCANPCPHADEGCKGFDFGKGGGCPGYWIAPETPP
jgi:hypothetical protein